MARLTKIFTRTGDGGMTGLVGGRRVRKSVARIEALGAVDELNAALGLARSLNRRRGLDELLVDIQHDLFDLGAELATPNVHVSLVTPAHVGQLEEWIDRLNVRLGPLQEFILPGGSPVGAALHLARTICRRAERGCVALARQERLAGAVVPYLNRLGDALFMLARWANHQTGRRETYWVKRRPASRQSGRRAR